LITVLGGMSTSVMFCFRIEQAIVRQF